MLIPPLCSCFHVYHAFLCPQLVIQGSGGQMSLSPFGVDVIKGWTRISCVAFLALVACDLDVTDSANVALLKPLEQVLDRAWLVPMHVPGI